MNVPGASSLAIGSWAGVPNGFVRHFRSVDFVLYLQLIIRFCVRGEAIRRRRRATDRAECEFAVGVEVDLFCWLALDFP
jgi:hypothetical protein